MDKRNSGLVYPSYEDIADINVINNNIRYLDGNKAEINHTHSNYANSNHNHDSEYYRKSEIDNKITSSQNHIIEEIKNSNKTWLHLLNQRSSESDIKKESGGIANITTPEKTIFRVNGRGTLIAASCYQRCVANGYPKLNGDIKFKLYIDGSIVLNIKASFLRNTVEIEKANLMIGLHNAQLANTIFTISNLYGPLYNASQTFFSGKVLGEKNLDLTSREQTVIIKNGIVNTPSHVGRIITDRGIKFNSSFEIKVSTDLYVDKEGYWVQLQKCGIFYALDN